MLVRVLVSFLRWRALRAQKSQIFIAGVRSLVVIELTRLGDFVNVLPAIRRFRQKFPGATIHVVVDSPYAPLLNLCEPGIEIIRVTQSASPFRFLMALRVVRRLAPDLACSMSPANRNAVMALSSGARFIVGYLNGTDSMTPFLETSPVESIGVREGPGIVFGRENIEGRAWKVLQSLGIREQRETANTFGAWMPEEEVVDRIHERGVVNGAPYIVVHPFSRWEYRSWPIASFGRLAEMILENLGHEVVFVCHASERAMLAPLMNRFRGVPRVRFFPSTDLIETAAVLRGAVAFVGNDSGPLHLAALLGLPIVGLFGPASPALAAPVSTQGAFVYRPVACSPCDQIRCIRPDDPCIALITPDEVFASLQKEVSSRYLRGAANA